MSTLDELRAEVAEVLDGLEAGGKTLRAVDYLSENLTPPCFAVVPGQPYISTSGPDLRFGHKRIRWDVLVLVQREVSKTASASMDALLLAAVDVLEETNEYDVVEAMQPGVVQLTPKGPKFFGSVIRLQHDAVVTHESAES